MQQPAKSLEKSHVGTSDALAILSPSIELQHLWFRLSNTQPHPTLALVPAERDVSVLGLVQGLAHVAASLPSSRVLLINASLRDCLPARGATTRPQLAFEDLAVTVDDGPYRNTDVVDLSRLPEDDAARALLILPQLQDHLESRGRTYTTTLVAVDSPLHQARSLPVARAADAAVLCVSLGQTSFDAARTLVSLIGPGKVIGAVAIH